MRDKRASDNRRFCPEGLLQTPSSVFPPHGQETVPASDFIPLGRFKALSLSGGWKNSCIPSTLQAVHLDSLFTHPLPQV